MFRTTNPPTSQGFTFIEALVGMSIFVVIGGMVFLWFSSQQRYQSRVFKISKIQNNMRVAVWKVIEEMKTARRVIWPRVNNDGSPRTADIVVFKNLKGEIISIYHRAADKTIRRCVIPNGPGNPIEDPYPIGKGIASATFTTMGSDNKLVSVHLQTGGVHYLDAVRFVNE